VKSSLVLVSLLASSLVANEFASYDGYLRAGFQHQDDSEFAVGGKLHFETNPINCVSFGTSFYTTQGIDKKYNSGVTFFSSSKHSYSILGEAYIKAMIQNTEIKLGRQEIDTPYADTDDIGMVPNSFEALTFSNSSFKDTTIFAGYLKKMSGVDAQIPEKFNSIGDVYTVGMIYEAFDGLTLSSWYYDASDLAKMSYVEAGYEKKFTNLNIGFDFQYTNQEFDNGNTVDVYGVSLAVEKSGVVASIAYDKANSNDGQAADNFFGGGPFFINCEHDTMSEVGANGEGIRYGLEFDISEYGVDGLGIFLSYLQADGETSDIEEIDVVASYEVNDKLSFDFIYSDATDNLDSSESFKNSRVFVNYSF
jgi:hypothetical protein